MIQDIIRYKQTLTLDEIKGNVFVIDDFLAPIDAEFLMRAMFDWDHFPWYMVPRDVAGVGEYVDNPDPRDMYFKHDFFNSYFDVSPTIRLMSPFVEKLVPRAFTRIRANVYAAREEPFQFGFHTDYDDIATAVYYVNTNNGATLFENGESVESKQGRLVLFDSNLKHTTRNQTDIAARMLINFNYVPCSKKFDVGPGTYEGINYG